MTNEFAISVMSRDKVGIVADVTSAINVLGGNLEDLSQTVMHGYFSMILLAAFPENVTAEVLRHALENETGLTGAVIGVREYEPVANACEDVLEHANLYVLTAVGQDHPGQVAAISRYLSERKINIVDLATRLNQGEYTMVFLIDIPAGLEITKIHRGLQLDVERLGLKVELRHRDIFQKTNEI